MDAMEPLFFRLLVPTVDDIRPSAPLGVDLPPAMEPAERVEFDAWLAERAENCVNAYEAEAAPETRDDGALYHGRLPSEDVEGFNPYIIARAEVWPGPVDVIDGARLPAESWLGMRGGAA